MSGHSKWAQIKRQKGVTDQKRGQLFSKLIHAISLAAKDGGADPVMNFKLRLAIDQAKEANMPNENIERAIQRGTGEGGERQIEDVIYEGYGPAGAAFMVRLATDNKNRALSEIKNTLSEFGGRLGGVGSVTWMFEQKGVIVVDAEGKPSDSISMVAIDAGAENIENLDAGLEIQVKVADLEKVKKALEGKKLKILSAEIVMIPKNPVEINNKADKNKIDRLVEALEEKEEVVEVFTNIK